MTKLYKFFITITFVFFSAGIANAQTSGSCGENLTWAFDQNTNTITISGTGQMFDYGDNDSNRAPWWHLSTQNLITNAIIEDGVTYIGTHAFLYCGSLMQFNIGYQVIAVRQSIFNSCI